MANSTVTYQYLAPINTVAVATLVRSTDGAFIPCNLGNSDYQAFLAWVKAGNTAPSGWTGPTN